MTTTTRAEPRYIVVAWAVAILLHLAAALLVWMSAGTEMMGRIVPAEHPVRPPPEHLRSHFEQRDRDRVLPEEHARLLVEQAELLIRQELQQRLERFYEIAGKVIDREEQLLQRIEQRPVDAYGSEINDTQMARANNHLVVTPLPPHASVEELYRRLAQLEAQIQENYTDSRAAELALRRGQAFPEVRSLLQPNTTRMPAFNRLVAEELAQWAASNGGSASGGGGPADRLEIRTIDDLNAYRQVLQRSVRESALAETRLASLVRPPSPGGRPPPGAMTWGPGSGSGDGGEYAEWQARRSSERAKNTRRPSLNPEIVQAQALPGRRFSRNSERRGWLYINTWYMIGPWDNFGRNDFAIIHPPELSIDFDAVYTDGMKGLATDTSGGRGARGKRKQIVLDGVLRWQFIQSESIQNVPPATIDWGTYYAYTELYFDEPALMYVAIGTDDSGKIWINGEEIWQDRGMSYYYIDEHLQLFQFRQGVNRILVRLENDGGGPTGFSFLVCPPEAVSQEVQR